MKARIMQIYEWARMPRMPADYSQYSHRDSHHSHFNAGFTLLETIVALTVIVAAMAGPISLTTRGIFSAKFAKNKLVAVNLAQEGLEIIRQCRDNSVLLNWPGGYASIGTGEWQADVLGNTLNSCPLSPFTGAALSRDEGTGLYNYSTGAASLFTRKITTQINFDCGGTAGSDRFCVTSRITWSEGGIDRVMTLQETLYNWR
ncbi:MAG: prepilin-type N-terminal cleavage/methylation domain-containing protein [Candidatus Sungiibacteriota bacterium]